MKKITLEEHFISPAYAQHVRDLQGKEAGTEFEELLADPVMRKGKDAPFAIGYPFEGKPHDYLPDAVGMLSNGTFFIAEAGMEDDKRGDRNLAKAEAARRLAHIRRGVFWIGTERTLTRQRHYNLVFLHARRKTFSTFAEIVLSVQEVWPWREVASVKDSPESQTQTLPEHAETGDQTHSVVQEPVTTGRDAVEDRKQSVKPPKCTFSGVVVPIELKRFLESGIALVECPDCASTRTLEPHGGVFRFKSHEKRKTSTPNTGPHWARGKRTGMWLRERESEVVGNTIKRLLKVSRDCCLVSTPTRKVSSIEK